MFEGDGATFDWSATFRVRSRAEIVGALQASELEGVDVRADEFVFIAQPNRATELRGRSSLRDSLVEAMAAITLGG